MAICRCIGGVLDGEDYRFPDDERCRGFAVYEEFPLRPWMSPKRYFYDVMQMYNGYWVAVCTKVEIFSARGVVVTKVKGEA